MNRSSSTVVGPLGLSAGRHADIRPAPASDLTSHRVRRRFGPTAARRSLIDSAHLAGRRLLLAVRRSAPSPLVVAGRHTPTFDVHVDAGSRVLTPSGAMDLAAVTPFTVAAASLTVGRRGGVTVDLGAVDFVDAAGLGAFVALRNILQQRGQQLTFVNARPAVARVFALGGLHAWLDTAY